MDHQERFMTALRRGIPDRVPMFDFLFQQPMYEHLIGHKPDGYNGKDAVECAMALNHDAVWVPFGGFTGLQPKYLSANVYQDEWGTTYQKNESSWPIDAPIDYPIKSREDLKKYKLPDPTLPGRNAEIVAAIEANHNNLAILGGVSGPLCTAWLLMGFERICYAIYEDPDLITEVLKLSNDYFKEAARRSVEAGCVGMWVSEDLGDSNSCFFAIDQFREIFLPYIADLAEYIDSLKVPVLLHSCGNINAYLDDLAQTKICSVHPLQRTAHMDLRTIKEKYGHRFCIIGNIDSTRTLPFGTPSDVAAEVKEAIEIAAPGGGYVLASDHSLHDGIPIENIEVMFRTGLEYGGY